MAMAEFKRITLFFTVILQFTAANENPSFNIVKAGDNATLICTSETYRPEKCEDINWLYHAKGFVTVIRKGEISEFKSKRLSLSGNCSLVISEVTFEDAGDYLCEDVKSKVLIQLSLSVVTFYESGGSDWVSFSCSVSSSGNCRHTPQWHFTGNHTAGEGSGKGCYTEITFYNQLDLPFETLLKCVVKEKNEEYTFPLSRQFPHKNTTAFPTTQGEKTTAAPTIRDEKTTAAPTIQASTDAAYPLHLVMLVLRVVQFVLTSVITALLVRALVNRRRSNANTVGNDEDEDDDAVRYENVEEPSVSV